MTIVRERPVVRAIALPRAPDPRRAPPSGPSLPRPPGQTAGPPGTFTPAKASINLMFEA